MCFHIFRWFSKNTLKGVCLSVQKQPSEAFYKKSVLKNFAKFTRKHLCQGLFYNPGQTIWNKMGRFSEKLDRARKVWYLLLSVFWLLRAKFNFSEGDWALGYVSAQIWDLSNSFLFPKILSLFFVCGHSPSRSATHEATRVPSLL